MNKYSLIMILVKCVASFSSISPTVYNPCAWLLGKDLQQVGFFWKTEVSLQLYIPVFSKRSSSRDYLLGLIAYAGSNGSHSESCSWLAAIQSRLPGGWMPISLPVRSASSGPNRHYRENNWWPARRLSASSGRRLACLHEPDPANG